MQIVGTFFLALIVPVTAYVVSRSNNDVRSKAFEYNYPNPFKVIITPSKISPTQSYTVSFIKDGSPYRNANLDYDLYLCDVNMNNCKSYSGEWIFNDKSLIKTDDNGRAVITPQKSGINGEFPTGVYLVRFKPRGETGPSAYSNFDLLVVDPSYQHNPNITYSGTKIPEMVKGSYVLYQNFDENNALIGYSRLEIESENCNGDGLVMRFTKSRATAYWSPGQFQQLRWCVNKVNTGAGEVLVNTDGTTYTSGTNTPQSYRDTVTTGYATDEEKYLGGFFYKETVGAPIYRDPDQSFHYSLLPPDNKLPNNLSTTSPVPVVGITFGHPAHWNYSPADGKTHTRDEGFDFWRTEAFALPGGGVRMRYNETGIYTYLTDAADIKSRKHEYDWRIVEDWSWDAKGLLTEINQYWDMPFRCWTPDYVCTTSAGRGLRAKAIEKFNPSVDTYPLQLGFRKAGTTDAFSSNLSINNTEAYEVEVKRITSYGATNVPSTFENYSGFLEVNFVGTATNQIWHDAAKRPIYFSRGRAIIGPSSYGSITSATTLKIRVRPFSADSSINTFAPADVTKVNILSQLPWSNEATLNMSLPTSYATTTSTSNTYPVVIKSTLPTASRLTSYKVNVSGYDINSADILTMTAANLPSGLTLGSCSQYLSSGRKYIRCTISGTPRAAGIFNPLFTVKDNHGGSRSTTMSLTVK